MRRFSLKILLLLSLGHLTVDLYQGALPAILPFLKEKLALTYTMAGVIMIVANFTSSLLQPVFGFLSDKEERAFLLPLGVITAGLGYSLVSLPSSYVGVLCLVIIGGCGVSAYHPEGFKTAAFFTGERRATGMSFFSVGGNLGFALGPIIAMWTITRFGFDHLPLTMVISLLVLFALLLSRKAIALPALPDGRVHQAVKENSSSSYLSLTLLIAVVFMRSWIQAGAATYIPFYYINVLKGDPIYAAKLVSVLLLGGAVGTLAGAPVADRWGYLLLVRISTVLSACIFPFILVTRGTLLFFVLFVLGIVLSSTFSVTIVMAQKLLPKNLGVASGLMTGFAIGAGGIGVTLLGVVADHFGVLTALRSVAILPVVAVILSMILRFSPE
jgi:MFS transporter, FSR family, fosmidomycin resistance protein